MRSLAAGVTTAFAATEVVLVTLVKLAFSSGTIALSDSTYSIAWGGDTYLAAAGLGEISVIEDKPTDIAGLKLELLQVDSAHIALALDDAVVVQGAEVTIRTAVLDATTHQVIDVVTDWTGYCDTMTIVEDGRTASIVVTAESKAVDLLRGTPLTYSDGDQQSLVPGDRYFEYVVSQSDKPMVWPSKGFFYQ